MKTDKTASQWEATFTINGFIVRDSGIQVENFVADRYGSLYQLGFDGVDYDSASLQFLQIIAVTFVEQLLEDGDLPLTMAPKSLPFETAQYLLSAVPFVLGREHITIDWLALQWEGLCGAFAHDLQRSGLGVAEYLREKTKKTWQGGYIFI